MATYQTYQMNGIKDEFADWVSNISPEYTPFVSMIAKFPVKNYNFQWQQDELGAVSLTNAVVEGSDATSATMAPTKLKSNVTQIMRKVVMVSDTANAVSSHGREKELFYQLKKAAKELKRDQEAIFLQKDQAKAVGDASTARKTASLGAQIAASSVATAPRVTAAVAGTDFEEKLFELTNKLYTAGAEPTVVMYNPAHANFFASLQEKSGVRQRIFENDKRFVKHVETIVDPLGIELKCIPNRWMPADTAYVFNPADIGQATLRAPQRIKLNKTGSAEKYMIEQEVGLRLNNDHAAGIMVFA